MLGTFNVIFSDRINQFGYVSITLTRPKYINLIAWLHEITLNGNTDIGSKLLLSKRQSDIFFFQYNLTIIAIQTLKNQPIWHTLNKYLYKERLYMNSPERTKVRRKNRHLTTQFGINYNQYNAMLAEQKHVCAICKKPEEYLHKTLAVDHCHTTKQVRGLLCSACNMALGKFEDNIEYLQNAIQYLTRDYQLPEISDTFKVLTQKERAVWRLLITTPDGIFPSAVHAGRYYKVHPTTIRNWCDQSSQWYRPGFNKEKVCMSLIQLEKMISLK